MSQIWPKEWWSHFNTASLYIGYKGALCQERTMREKEEINTEGDDTDTEEVEQKKYEQLELFDEDQVAPI